MTSTVVDVGLALLLVSAAAVTIATVPTDSGSSSEARETATTLTATTASIEYTLAPGARRADPALADFERTSGPAYQRRAHGSLATLLADAAVRDFRIEGHPLTHAATDFRTGVVAETASTLGGGVQVVVSWRPYPGSHLGRSLTVGPTPPTDADVDAATVTVDSGVPAVEDAENRAAADGFEGLAGAVAAALVEGLFPPDQARLALAGDDPLATLMRYRYRRAAEIYGADLEEPLAENDAREANRRLEAAMAERVEADLRAAFDSPEAAAEAVAPEAVEITVRTWST